MPYTFEKPPELRDLQQVYSYLYRMSEELEGALNNITAADVKDLGARVDTAISNATAGSASAGQLATHTAELQALIINTADTIESSMQEIKQTLTGSYVAKSDFGSLSTAFINEELQSATGRTNLYSQFTTLSDTINTYITDTRAKIFTGLLYTEDKTVNGVTYQIPHYGVGIAEDIRVGTITYTDEHGDTHEEEGVDLQQTQTVSYFTSDQLQFWIAGTKVAYITNKELFITRGRFDNEIRIGNIAGVIDGTDKAIVRWYVKG